MVGQSSSFLSAFCRSSSLCRSSRRCPECALPTHGLVVLKRGQALGASTKGRTSPIAMHCMIIVHHGLLPVWHFSPLLDYLSPALSLHATDVLSNHGGFSDLVPGKARVKKPYLMVIVLGHVNRFGPFGEWFPSSPNYFLFSSVWLILLFSIPQLWSFILFGRAFLTSFCRSWLWRRQHSGRSDHRHISISVVFIFCVGPDLSPRRVITGVTLNAEFLSKPATTGVALYTFVNRSWFVLV